MIAAILALALIFPVQPTHVIGPAQASWYCLPGRSACTRGYPAAGPYAAAGPALRVGNWRGRWVRVCTASRCIRAKLVDWCLCNAPGRVVDLYAGAFARLAPLSGGVVRVRVEW